MHPPARRWLAWCSAGALIVVLFASAALASADFQWWLVQRKIHGKFPSVRQISTGELASWLKDSRHQQPLLLDVRTVAEFEVSHLAGAQRIEPNETVAEAKLSVAKNTPIVTYCSVGYRSSAFAEKLHEAGFTNVQNLEGSIFQWANENRPLVDARGVRTGKAHPYSSIWGRMLNPAHRAAVRSEN
jgi:rhodanese-related sulfurtransferase